MLYLRPGERRARIETAATFGVAVVTGGRRLFFPGDRPETAMILAGMTLAPAELDAARVEFGEQTAAGWVRRELVQEGEHGQPANH